MKKLLFFLTITFTLSQVQAQFVHKIKADSVLITNDSCTAELNLENSTKHIKGFMYKKSNRRTKLLNVINQDNTTINQYKTFI